MATLSPKYPHSRGLTRLAYSPDGRYLLTTGANSLVRRFNVGSTREPDTIDIDSAGLGIAVSERHFAVATEDGTVQLFDIEGSTPNGLVLRSSLPVRHIEFSDDGQWLAASGDDTVSIVDVDDITSTRILPTQPRQSKHISFRPGSSLVVAVSGLDGAVRVYDFSESPDGENASLLFTLESVLPFISDNADTRSTAAIWSPDGSLFAVQTKSFDIVFYSTESWLEEFRISGSDAPLTDLRISPNGVYLAATNKSGSVLIWDIAKRNVIHRYDDISEASQVRWHPHANVISFTTDNGQLYSAPGVTDEHPAPFGEVVRQQRSEKKRRQLEEELEDLQAEPMSDFLDEMPDESYEGANNEGRDWQDRSTKRLRSERFVQAAFQSGCTPWLNERRYLCMNQIGYIWSVQQSTEHNSITVSFFDSGTYRDVSFRDSDRVDLASLSKDACLLADSRSGRVMMRFHRSFADNWEYVLPNDTVRSLALSDEVAVVCTNKGLVMTFTHYGTPLSVNRQSRDPVITCAAHDNTVMVVRQAASGFTYTLEDAVSQTYYQKDDVLDVPADCQIKSVFFTETGDPCVVDSKGVLTVLVHWRVPGQSRWVPLFDSIEYARTQNRQESYWGLGIVDTKLVCVVLKGRELYPPIPLPVTTEVDLAVPGVEGVEGEYIVRKIFYTQAKELAEHLGVLEEQQEELASRELDLDKLLLRQLQAACTENRVNKGLRIASQIQQQEALEAAAKIALHFNLTSLADRIMEAVG